MDEIIAIVFLSQLAGFVIKGLAGFGNPLLTNPLMAMRLDNVVITPTNILLDLPANAWISWRARHSFQIRQVLPVLIAILLGVIPGTLLLKLGTPWIIKALLGVFIIGLGIEMLLRDRTRGMTPRSWLRNLLSFASGVMSGLFGINMLFLAYIERVSADLTERPLLMACSTLRERCRPLPDRVRRSSISRSKANQSQPGMAWIAESG